VILLTVGTQLPFDRMVKAVDDWAIGEDRSDIVAQVGPSRYPTTRINSFPFSDPAQMRRLQEESRLIIAHAGIGSIVTALELGKPIIIMPRDHERGEHRNGHQLATARRFQSTPGIYVAADEHELAQYLLQVDTLMDTQTEASVSQVASDGLLNGLRDHLAKIFATAS
jgi:UDP-N-acetylglucosamine transferase subunit ALG13